MSCLSVRTVGEGQSSEVPTCTNKARVAGGMGGTGGMADLNSEVMLW